MPVHAARRIAMVKKPKMAAKKKPMAKKARALAQSRRARAMSGAGLFDWISKAVSWVKDNKIISKVGDAISSIPGMHPIVGTVTELAKTAGLGRRPYGKAGKAVYRGGALRLAGLRGSGVNLAGGRAPSREVIHFPPKLHVLM